MRPSEHMISVKRRAEKRLLRLPGVTGVDIGFKEIGGQKSGALAIRVLVKQKRNVLHDQQIPAFIEGYPTDVIERDFKLHIDTTLYDPLVGGCSIGPCRLIGDLNLAYAGTLGAIVIDRISEDYMALSNYHILCVDPDCAVGDGITQPSLVDDGLCPTTEIGQLARWSIGGKVDAAVCWVGDSYSRGVLPEIQDIGELYGTNSVSIGEVVRKRGRTSGLRYGTVDGVELSITTTYETLGAITLTGQIGILPEDGDIFGTGGDSGSIVVNSHREAVGLYYAGNDAGYGVANPITDVLEALGVDLYTSIGSYIPDWPDEVPLPLLEAAGAPEHPIIASDTKGARIERRLRFSGDAPITLNVRWVFSPAQFHAFKHFFTYELDAGAGRFNMEARHPKTSGLMKWRVRFDGGYRMTYEEGLYAVSAKLTLLHAGDAPEIVAPEGTGYFLVQPDAALYVGPDGYAYAVHV